jgi:predicted dithiol-disulfide oxidoreductase (DUF899 family)
MLGPGDTAGCPGCSWTADHVDGAVVHLNHRDVTTLAVSDSQVRVVLADDQRLVRESLATLVGFWAGSSW